MKFTLSFAGSLQTGGNKAGHKHKRRRVFHDQLKCLWNANPLLNSWMLPVDNKYVEPAKQVLAQRFGPVEGIHFVPLVSKDISVETALKFHILRPTTFKGETRDIDNIVKTLVDSLRMPQNADEIPKNLEPDEGENPFFVLLEDDSLVSSITSVGDELLQPIEGNNQIERSDTRVFIEVFIRPSFPNHANLIFFSDDFEIWNHKWTEGVYDSIRSWSNTELKARTTQCILRMRVTSRNFLMQMRANDNWQPSAKEDFAETGRKWRENSAQHQALWNSGLRPIALALLTELERRLGGEKPNVTGYRLHAVRDGMLAGVDPISDAAEGLQALLRELP